MPDDTAALETLLARVRDRTPRGAGASPEALVSDPEAASEMYRNHNARLGIDFTVSRFAFPGTEAIDPRVLRVAPGAANERHRHAHESLFVVLSGEGSVCIGDDWVPVRRGQVVFVPRWGFHQTRNDSVDEAGHPRCHRLRPHQRGPGRLRPAHQDRQRRRPPGALMGERDGGRAQGARRTSVAAHSRSTSVTWDSRGLSSPRR